MTTETAKTPIDRRHEFVLFFDVTNGNPNGDPDAGNMPRVDPETGHGLVSDVCLKRKVRNFVEMTKEGEPGHRIYVGEGAVLNDRHREAYAAIRPDDASVKTAAKLTSSSDDESRRITAFMTENFFDIRTFGAVMGTGINAGQVKGPVQLNFARSVEPIQPLEISITRMAATKDGPTKSAKPSKASKTSDTVEDDVEGGEVDTSSDKRGDRRTMGRKHIVPYGLYRVHGFVSAHFGAKTGFTEADLETLLTSLEHMFDHDRSAARGEMSARKLIVFRHSGSLGNAQAHSLFDRVTTGRDVGGEFRPIDDMRLDNLPPARKFSDYMIRIDRDGLPDGVEVIERI